MKATKEGRYITFTDDCGQTVRFDLKDAKAEKFDRKKGVFKPIAAGTFKAFFSGMSMKNEYSWRYTSRKTIKLEDWFEAESPYIEVIKALRSIERKLSNVGSVLLAWSRHRNIEPFILNKIPISLYSYTVPRKTYNEYPKEALELFKLAHVNVSRYLENYAFRYFKLWKDACTYLLRLDNEEKRDVITLSLHDYGNFEHFNFIVETARCEYKRAIEYIWEQMKLNPDGYLRASTKYNYTNSLRLLRDYHNMAHQMELRTEKYPKNLREAHDTLQMNYNYRLTEIQENNFLKNVNQSLAWEKEGSNFVVIVPKIPKDIVTEGSQQSHCVGSYVSRVCEGTTQIVFLRDKNDLARSVVTLEVRDDNITQARGFANRLPDEKESNFIRAYAKAKKLRTSCSLTAPTARGADMYGREFAYRI